MKIGKPQREVFIEPLPDFIPEPLRSVPEESPKEQPVDEPAKKDA